MQAECFETMPAEAVNRMGNASQQERNAVEADGKHDGADPLQRLVKHPAAHARDAAMA